jgi:hypothetical protein
LEAEPVYQRESFPESPAIHVVVLPDVDPTAFRWVRIGAEEEGVPCREAPVRFRGDVPGQAESRVIGGEDPVAAAYAAAQESRLGVGVAAGHGRVTLHEAHMPAERPVWEFPLAEDLGQACRLVGSNAGRLVKRMPLRFESEELARAAESRRSSGGQSHALSEIALAERAGTEAEAEYLTSQAWLRHPAGGASQGSGAADLAAIVASIVRSLQRRGIV